MRRGELTAVWFKLKNCSLRLGSWSLVSLALRMGAHHGRANIDQYCIICIFRYFCQPLFIYFNTNTRPDFSILCCFISYDKYLKQYLQVVWLPYWPWLSLYTAVLRYDALVVKARSSSTAVAWMLSETYSTDNKETRKKQHNLCESRELNPTFGTFDVLFRK